jgi:opacity protein-like surface antigen
MHIIPKNGQSQEQLWNDRYSCHTWAQSQSGFDAARAGRRPRRRPRGREKCRQAMVAFLDNRGYEVQFGTPAHAVPPPVLPPAASPPVHTNELKYHPLMFEIGGGYTFTNGDTTRSLQDGGGRFIRNHLVPELEPAARNPLRGQLQPLQRDARLAQAEASIATGTNVAYGHTNLYGGNIDARLILRRSPRFGMYLFGGIGRYRTQTVFKQVMALPGVICYYYCYPGLIPVESVVSQTTSEWTKSWNDGFGMEWALSDPVRFFIEGRYMRLAPYDQNNAFIPVQIGLRF